MNEAPNAALDAERVWKMIGEIRICMLVTHDGEDLRARPMEACPRENENALYFLTDAHSPKSSEIGENGAVCLTFARPSEGKFLSVSAEARLLDDRPLIRAVWKPEYEMFWENADDPNLRVLEVTPREAQLWERPGGLIGTVGFVAARAAGQMPDLGDQRKVELH